MKSEEVDAHHSAEEMDLFRQKQDAYEYLCHLEEAKKWLELVVHEELPSCTELEEFLRNGVVLAKIAHLVAPETVPYEFIYDIEMSSKLKTFHPTTSDVSDKKNMPRVIYCIHAWSSHLFNLGKAPQIPDLYGKVAFTDEQITAMSLELQINNVQLPAFQKIKELLAKELPGDAAASNMTACCSHNNKQCN